MYGGMEVKGRCLTMVIVRTHKSFVASPEPIIERSIVLVQRSDTRRIVGRIERWHSSSITEMEDPVAAAADAAPAAALQGEEVITALSTAALDQKLRSLRELSNQHSQALTQKLATSQSGQNLLHIGSSLSTLPPDLHSLLTQLHPILSAAEATEKSNLASLQRLVGFGNTIRAEQRRVEHAAECADVLEDLLAAERDVKRDASLRRGGVSVLIMDTKNVENASVTNANALSGEDRTVFSYEH
jgi:hypothetical protein